MYFTGLSERQAAKKHCNDHLPMATSYYIWDCEIFSLKGAVNDSIVQFRNWLFLVYYSLFKLTKDILYLLDSLIFSVSFYKSLQCMSQQSFLPSVTVSCLSVRSCLWTQKYIHIHILVMYVYIYLWSRGTI